MITGDIKEDGDLSVSFRSRLGHELDAVVTHALVSSSKVIDAQEETNTTGKLLSHRLRLLFAICTCKKERRARVGRSNHDPPLGSAVVSHGGRVFEQLEAEALHEELDGLVVVFDDHSDLLEVHEPQGNHPPRTARPQRALPGAVAATRFD